MQSPSLNALHFPHQGNRILFLLRADNLRRDIRFPVPYTTQRCGNQSRILLRLTSGARFDGQNSMIERIEYRGWHNAYKISNGRIHLIVLSDVGPRIIWYGFCGGENQLHEVDADAGVSGGTSFRLYGGHRLWVSPEVESTYFPDNVPVSVSQHGREVCFTAPPEMNRPGTGLQKEMRIRLEDSGSHLTITHRITNHAATSARLAPWTPTMMRP